METGMSTTVAVPLWLGILIAMLAGLALLDRLLVPSARWFLRSRASKVLDEVGSRLKIQIRPFQQSSRAVRGQNRGMYNALLP
jgi:glycerol-3-phosphate O-acyltransferase